MTTTGLKTPGFHRVLAGLAALVLLLVMQVCLGKTGHYFAGLVPYQQLDPYNTFAGISIHHFVQMILALIIILILSRFLKLDFRFRLGDTRRGIKYLTVFTLIFAVVTLLYHFYLYSGNNLPGYAFPLDFRNIGGTLGFQLLLSGTSEEIVFRALPITILVFAFGKSVPLKGGLTLEVFLASILFSFAHITWSLTPLSFEVDAFRVGYSFLLGSIQGIVYQKTGSILYPVLMHSFSNVLMVGIGYLFTSLLLP